MNQIVYAGKHLLTYSVPRHSHASWEFVYCTGGEGVFDFSGCALPYRAGDVVLIPPMEPHSNESRDGFTNVHVNVVEPTLSAAGPTVVRADSMGFLLNAFNAAFFHYSDPSSRSAPLLAAYGELIVRYLSVYQSDPDQSGVVREIENHIIHNYPDCDFELDEYLRSLPFSYDYLRKLFKREIGVTPHRYLSDKRLEIAASLLGSDDGRTIAEVAHLCGFREPLYFSRMFKKKYGVAPTAFSHAAQGAHDPESIKILL